MSGLVRHISNLAARGYGINIFEQAAPGSISGAGADVIGMVADLPWGPVNEVVQTTSTGAFSDAFAPLVFGNVALNGFPALKALMNKKLPNLKVCRTAPTGQVKATLTLDDAGVPTASIDVTAKHFGSLGNLINVEVVANVATPANRDVIVSIGTAYSVRYLDVVTAAPLATVDPGDPYVTITANVAQVLVPVVAAAAPLATGADGTSAAGDYTATGVGIDKFAGASVDVTLLFCAEVPSAQVDAVNTKLQSWAIDEKKGMAVYSTPALQDLATAKTYLASNSLRTDRAVYSWPTVKTTNGFDPDNALVDVDPNSFVISAIAQHGPSKSPGGASGRFFLTGIKALAIDTAKTIDYDELNAAGVAPIYISKTLGAIIRNGLTTDITPGLTRIKRRRMADFIMVSISDFGVFYVEETLDLDLGPPAQTGPITGAFVGAVDSFLQSLRDDPTGRQIAGFDPTDPFSANSQANLDADEWRVVIVVKLDGDMANIILLNTIGSTVVLQEQ